MAEVKSYFLLVFLTMVRVICWDIIKVQVEEETAYVSDIPPVIVGQYIWLTVQVHRVMDNLFEN